MLRFIIRQKSKCSLSSLETEEFYTLDCSVPELENVLTSGGVSQHGYEKHFLEGVSILVDLGLSNRFRLIY